MQLYFYVIYFTKEGGIHMFKFLAKMAEKYAKVTNTMPASLIKKD